MPLTILRGPDQAPLTPLHGRTVAVLGFGNQGRAHAENLRDSGIDVVVGARAGGDGWRAAAAAGFVTLAIDDAAAASDLVVIALPDEIHGEAFTRSIGPHLSPGCTIGFLHGFSVRFGLIVPPENVGVVMVAPKGPGTTLRARFERGEGIPCLFAVQQESPARNSHELGLAWAHGIGCHRAGIICTTFADETETDLFGEQAVLCGGLTWLMLAAFETLVEAGYAPELAYLECCHEVKQIADLVHERGLAGMMQAISNTAEFGAYTAGPKLIDDALRRRLRELLADIREDRFAKGLARDHAGGFEWFKAQRSALASHEIDRAGGAIRDLLLQSKG